jgi:outer membrane protein assembly factor BamB
MGVSPVRRWLLLFSALVLSGLALVLSCSFRRNPPAVSEGPSVVWLFEAQKRGAIASSPLVAGNRVYVGAIHDTAFDNRGAVYCLDRATGKVVWRFDDRGKMQHMYSSPCLAEGRLYIGEGMHANFTCKLYCLDAATGRKDWDFVAEGHVESSPCVAGGRVFFGAGDDGVYCLDAKTGQKRWQFRGPFHIDASPAVQGDRLYVGSGVSVTYRQTEAMCLSIQTGKVLWRAPVNLPLWGSPEVADGDVFFGLGNGHLQVPAEPPEKPAGALVCLAADTGKQRWRYDVSDAVFARAAVTPERVYFGARDGHCYCLDRDTGQLAWKQHLGSPVMTTPLLLDERVYVVASGGRVFCLDSDSGRARWVFDVAEHSGTRPLLFSSPAGTIDTGEDGPVRRLYFGAELRSETSGAAVLYCLAP